MPNRNITLSVPQETLQQVKIIAVKRQTSVSRLLTEKLEELIAEETGYLQAQRQFMSLLGEGIGLGTQGRVTWSRDELHER